MNVRIDPHSVWIDIQAIKNFSPLVHNITNFVVMEQTANSLLAIGASPVMAHALEEVEEMTMLANSLVLNIGTLSSSWVDAMFLALNAACSKNIPIVFDPVGAGATSYRTNVANKILSHQAVTVIRGNASEIVSLNERICSTKGVDSTIDPLLHLKQAKTLADQYKCIVWMSGKTDIVTDGLASAFIHNGHPLMGKVTGMGCTATAITGAFLSVNPSPLMGSIHAAILMGVAGEVASNMGKGPGSYQLSFTDALFNISLKELEKRMNVEIL